jgi:hypothetical protein
VLKCEPAKARSVICGRAGVHDLYCLEQKISNEESKINYEIVNEQYKYCDKLLQKAYDKYGKFIKQVEYFIGIGENPHIIILVSMFDIPFKEIFY